MPNATNPPLLDNTGQTIVNKIDNIANIITQEPTPATQSSPGVVKIDGTTITINENGVISAPRQGATFVEIPVVTGTSFTYDGTSKAPTITNLDTEHVTVIGTESAINAGEYTITFALTNAQTTVWKDKTTGNKTTSWSIGKATGSLSLSKASVSLDTTTTSTTVNVNVVGDGSVTLTSSNIAYATVTPNTLNGSGVATITGQATGSATITATLQDGTNYTGGATATCDVTVSFVPLKTFAAATDAEIAQMVAAADRGEIDLYEDCGWRVGQERSCSLSAIASSGTYDGVGWSVGESQSAQTVTLVLMHRGLYQLVTPVLNKNGNSRSTCSFVVGVKNCLGTKGYISSGLYVTNWDNCARRHWCNGGFRLALPTNIRNCFKQFRTTIGTWSNNTSSGGSIYTTTNYFILPAEKESLGRQYLSTSNECDALSQLTWYATAANLKKYQGNTSNYSTWWTRSPTFNNSENYCYFPAYSTNSTGGYYPNMDCGFSPFGCM